MSGNSSDQALIDQLLRDRDAEYRRASKAEQQPKELTDAKETKAAYEAKLAKKEEALRERDKTIEAKDNRIAQLEQKLLYLERKMWGAMSEKRQIPDDPNQLKLDFGQLEMSPEEEETARKAIEEITDYKKVIVKGHEKRVPVRHKLPENLRHVEEHIYPEGCEGHMIPRHPNIWSLTPQNYTSE